MPQADRAKLLKDVLEWVWQTRSPRHFERQALACDVASQRFADAFDCSATGAVAATHLTVRTVSELGSNACAPGQPHHSLQHHKALASLARREGRET